MKPFEDATLIALVLACCEDPTHPVEPLSDWIREKNYPDYMCNVRDWYHALAENGYWSSNVRRFWTDILDQLSDIGTWEKRG